MKKIIFSAFLAASFLLSGNVQAQSPISVDVRGGLNLADLSEGYQTRLKYHIGIGVDYEFSSNFYFMSGLTYSARGGKKHLPDAAGYEQKLIVNPSYLELPMHLGCKLNIGGGNRLVFHTGPYMALGVSGKSKLSYTEDNKKIIQESDYFGKGGASRFDLGLGLGLGLEGHRLKFGVSYDFGLINKKSLGYDDAKNRNIAFTLGYRIF